MSSRARCSTPLLQRRGAAQTRDLDVSFQYVVHPAPTEEAGVAKLQCSKGDRMNVHKNARLTMHSRAELVRRVVAEGQTPKAVATAFGVCPRTVGKWVGRFRAEGVAGLVDRSSRPRRLRQPTPSDVLERIATLRRQRWTGKQIAREVGVSPATVSRVLRRLGMSRLKDLE